MLTIGVCKQNKKKSFDLCKPHRTENMFVLNVVIRLIKQLENR